MRWLLSKLTCRGRKAASPGPADYCKHQLYIDGHRIDSQRRVKLPDASRWIPLTHLGERRFRPENTRGDNICLVLQEDRGAGKGFWSVMSFLTKEEAIRLSEQLAAASQQSGAKAAADQQPGTISRSS